MTQPTHEPSADLGAIIDASEDLVVGSSHLEEVRGRLAAIVDSSDDAILSKTLEGVITSWNRGAEKLFGFTAAEAVGQPVLLIIPPDRRAEEADVLGRIRRGEAVEHFETVRRRKDGTLVDISLTVSPVRDGTGRVVGASKIARDITDRKRVHLVKPVDPEKLLDVLRASSPR